jgi:hypothetical protein
MPIYHRVVHRFCEGCAERRVQCVACTERAFQQITRTEVRQVLVWLIDGTIIPEEADEWAVNWIINDDQLRVFDDAVWRLLMHLAGSDLQTAPGEYLFDKATYEDWLEEFDQRIPTN